MQKESQKRQDAKESYNTSWYSLNPNRLLATLGVLKGEINCDVCVIGGGFTGISAALELALKGYSVILLEAQYITDSAAGKNSSHLLRGYNLTPASLADRFDPLTARVMCNLTLEGLALIIARIAKYDIKCDLKFGHITAAMNSHQASSLKRQIDEWAEIGHTDLGYLEEGLLKGYIRSEKYIGGIFDPKGAHFHPLNYALGVAQAAMSVNCKIYDETPVVSVEQGPIAKIVTPYGVVHTKFIVLAGRINLPGIVPLEQKVITVTSHMIATEPLETEITQKILPKNSAVMDNCRLRNHFQLTSDNRLLFGGGRTYGKTAHKGQDESLRRKMVDIFPELAKVKIANYWHSPMDVTFNRLPVFGRIGDNNNIFYAHGYYTNGIILSNLAGKLIAEAVSGTAERFDVFAHVRHMPVVGGEAAKRALYAFGIARDRLCDLLF